MGSGPTQGQRSGALLDQIATARHHTGEASIRALVEDQRPVVRNIALQARAVALQRARADGGTAAIAVGARQYQSAITRLGQAAGARQSLVDGKGVACVGDIETAAGC